MSRDEWKALKMLRRYKEEMAAKGRTVSKEEERKALGIFRVFLALEEVL